jgi:hypothetical protein
MYHRHITIVIRSLVIRKASRCSHTKFSASVGVFVTEYYIQIRNKHDPKKLTYSDQGNRVHGLVSRRWRLSTNLPRANFSSSGSPPPTPRYIAAQAKQNICDMGKSLQSWLFRWKCFACHLEEIGASDAGYASFLSVVSRTQTIHVS